MMVFLLNKVDPNYVNDKIMVLDFEGAFNIISKGEEMIDSDRLYDHVFDTAGWAWESLVGGHWRTNRPRPRTEEYGDDERAVTLTAKQNG